MTGGCPGYYRPNAAGGFDVQIRVSSPAATSERERFQSPAAKGWAARATYRRRSTFIHPRRMTIETGHDCACSSAEAQRLDDLAATQIIADPEVARCWELVRIGIQTLKLGMGNLGRLLAHLRAGNGMTLDELTIEVDEADPARALVGILDDQRFCSAPKLIAELERLAARSGPSDPTGPAGDANSGRPAAGEGSPDLLGLLAGLLGTTPDRLAGDPGVLPAPMREEAATA
jgi:hypothetical protein